MTIKDNFNNRKVIILLASAAVLVFILIITFIILSNKIETYDNSSDILSTDDSAHFTSESSLVSDVESSDISEEISEPIDESENSTAEEKDYGWYINKYGYTYLYNGCGYEQFNYSTRILDRYANSINSILDYIPQSANIYSITVPVSSEFADIPREIYIEDGFYNKSQSAFVSTVATKVEDRIITIPIVNLIKEKFESGEYVFFRTDKNWTPLASYYTYVEFCKEKGLRPYALSNFPKIETGEYLGRFYLATNSLKMEERPDSFICYSTLPSVKTALTVYDDGIVYTDFSLCGNDYDMYNAYNIFLGMSAGRYEVNTTADGGALLILGDESAYPMLPFLAAHYRTIDVINPQYYDGILSEFLSEHKYDDVITMCYSTNATSGDYIPAFNELTGVTDQNG